jgi:hypothetical protein
MEPISTSTGASTLGAWYLPNCCEGDDVSPPDTSENNNGGGVFNSGTASAGPSFDVNHTTGGKYSAMLKIDTSVTSWTQLFRWLEPQNYPDLYYSVWLYFPQVYTPSQYWAIVEWKSSHPAGNAPFWMLNVSNHNGSSGPMSFYLWNAQTNTTYNQSLTTIPVGQWTNVQAHYVCAGDNTGHVTIWQDGTQIFDLTGVQTRYSDGTCAWDTESNSNGLTPNPATIYVDDAKICSGGLCS